MRDLAGVIALIGIDERLLEHAAVRQDDMEQVVEVMGDAASELPDQRNTIAVGRLGLTLSLLGDVADHHHGLAPVGRRVGGDREHPLGVGGDLLADVGADQVSARDSGDRVDDRARADCADVDLALRDPLVRHHAAALLVEHEHAERQVAHDAFEAAPLVADDVLDLAYEHRVLDRERRGPGDRREQVEVAREEHVRRRARVELDETEPFGLAGFVAKRHGHHRPHAVRRQARGPLQHRVAVDLGAHVGFVTDHHLAEHARRYGERSVVAVAAARHRHERSLRMRLVDHDRASVGVEELEAGLEHASREPLQVVLDTDRAA